MTSHRTDAGRPHARLRSLLCLAVIFVLDTIPSTAFAARQDITFELWPHCVSGEVDNVFGGPMPDSSYFTKLTEGKCRPFETRDPLTRQTEVLDTDGELDIDIIMRNPSGQSVSLVRTWIAYDPSILEGTEVQINPIYASPIPGESDFSPTEGFIKIGASSDTGTTEDFIAIARIRLTVINNPGTNTVLSFYDASTSPEGHTVAMVQENEEDVNVLDAPLGSLLVRLKGSGGEQSSNTSASIASIFSSTQTSFAAVSSASASSADAVSSAVPAPISAGSTASTPPVPIAQQTATVFTLLQVQNLRATTEGSSVFLAWDPLPSTELRAYNVYYGTVSGQYIQRRTVDRTATTLTVRGLPVGTTYYFAVRGVNATGDETDFSKEVGIAVGNPATSTSPLSGSVIDGGPQGQTPATGGNVAGSTGSSSILLVFACLSAVIGTAFALRRQVTATIPTLP